ncbi:hypothetical protein VNO77_17521 [Canavalia gladiata]|uniref:Uncharacterized protein n=1 Tax=Canavalia gladiata TaxID=3824 RepID=A0AAN9LMX6_CANGL
MIGITRILGRKSQLKDLLITLQVDSRVLTTRALGMIGTMKIQGRKNQLKGQLPIAMMVGLAGIMPKMMDLIMPMEMLLIIKLLVIMRSRVLPGLEEAFSKV